MDAALRTSGKRNSKVLSPSVKYPTAKVLGKKRAKKPKVKHLKLDEECADLAYGQVTSVSTAPVEGSKYETPLEGSPKPKSMPPILEAGTTNAQLEKDPCPSGYSDSVQKPTILGRLGCGFCKNAWTRMIDVADDHKAILEDSKPEVAMLVPWDEKSDIEEPTTPRLAIPPGLKVRASGGLTMYGDSGKLLVMQLHDEHAKSRTIPAEQLKSIASVIEAWKPTTLMGSVPWALHDPSVTAAILAREAEVLATESKTWRFPVLSRILHTMRIIVPEEDGSLISAYRRHFGEAFAFQAAWAYFFIQALWFLVPFAIGAIIFDFSPAVNGAARAKFETFKVVMIAWGFVVAAISASRYQGDKAVAELKRMKLGTKRRSTVNEGFDKVASEAPSMKISCRRWGTLLFLAIPALILFIWFCMLTLLMTTNLILHVIYVWGDCYNLHTPEIPCRDAERKHGYFGWAAEVGCDVALAILFELFFSISQLLSVWISSLLNFEYASDKRFFELMLEVFLSALERIGFVGSLAFAFAPQWEPPHGGHDTIDMSIDCSDLLMGASAFQCLQRRLPASLRRWLLEKLMKGPFTVAPFVSIGIKTLLPLVILHLHRACDYCTKLGVWCWPTYPCRFIARFFTLIFTLDGDNVSCCSFPVRGWPFQNVSADHLPCGGSNNAGLGSMDIRKLMSAAGHSTVNRVGSKDVSVCVGKRRHQTGEKAPEIIQLETDFLTNVLEQGTRKPFLPADELMELEMAFLWVLFFTPLRPVGALTMLAARMLEIHFDMFKMSHVRRRNFPTDDKEMRRGLTSFVNSVILASIGWTLGLSLITYNDDLYLWGVGGKMIFLGMVLWLFFCAALGFIRSMGYGTAKIYAIFYLLGSSSPLETE